MMSQRLRRMLLVVVLSPLLLLALGAVALYIPWVQDAAVRYATARLGESLGMEVRIGRLRLGFPAELSVEDFVILPRPTDTLLRVDRLAVGLSLRPLLSREVVLPRTSLQGLLFNQHDSLGRTHTRIEVPRGVLESVRISFADEQARIGLLQTEGGRVLYTSTDTTSSSSEPLEWRIRAEQLRLLDTDLEVRLPHDSIFIRSQVELLDLQTAYYDLKTGELELGYGRLSAPLLTYAVDELPAQADYLDPRHLDLSALSLELANVHHKGSDLSLSVKKGAFRERSGFALTRLQGLYRMDSLRMHLSNMAVQTDYSSIYGELELPWSLLEEAHRGDFYTLLDGAIGAEDVRLLTGHSLLAFDEGAGYEGRLREANLTGPIDFALHTRGSLDSLWIDQCQLLWGDVLDLSARGSLTDVMKPKLRRGNLSVEGGLQSKANALLALSSPQLVEGYSLPEGLTFKGDIGFGGGRDRLSLKVREGNGVLDLNGDYDELARAYDFKVSAERIDLSRYVRHTSFGTLTAQAELRGRGLDWQSKRTEAVARVRLNNLSYVGRELRDITLDGSLKSGAMALAVNSFNPGLNLAMQLDGLLLPDGVNSSIVLQTDELSLHQWGLTDLPLTIGGQLSGELYTDYKQTHRLATSMADMRLSLRGREILPKEVSLNAQSTPTSSLLQLRSGDLSLEAQLASGPDELGRVSTRLSSLLTELAQEIIGTEPMRLELEDLLSSLPEGQLSFAMGGDNALRPYLAEQRLSVGQLSAQLDISKELGLRGQVTAQNIRQDTLRISRASLGINTLRLPRGAARGDLSSGISPIATPDSLVLDLSYALSRERYRAQEGYDISGNIRSSLAEAEGRVAWVDMAGRLRHRVEVGASWSGPNYTLYFPSPKLLLGYQSLDVNPDNSLRVHKKTLGIESDIRLAGEGGALLAIQAQYDPKTSHQEGTLQLQRLRLEDYRTLGLPDLGGVLFADVRYGRTGGWDIQPTITGDLSVQRLRYEDKELGHFATALFYEPRTDRSHYISAEMSYRGEQALSVDAIYYLERKDDALSGTLALKSLPLEMANPFLRRYGINLGGKTSGELALFGSLSAPRLEGAVRGNEARVLLEQYATTLELDSLPLRFASNALHFDHYALRSPTDRHNPLYIDGSIGLSGAQAMMADLKLRATDMTLLNQPRPRSERELIYGRLVASTDMTLRGPLDALKVRGVIDIQGGTNCTYVLREGGLEGDSQADELLSFVDFADTLFTATPVLESRLGGLDVNLALHIDPSVRLGVDLTADGTDYMRVQGGGDMQFSYPPYGEMKLLGRYNMSGGGQLHYTIPVVGGKLFEIAPTGYLRFGGNIYNPYINFKATQQIKATVGSASKKTNFLVGIEVKDHIEDIKLGFDLSAPEDLSVQNTLSTMTAEERGKQAIGLMATGLFLAGRSGGKLKFDSALSSLLQSQINKAAGSLLRGTDINIGMETHDGTSGGAYTDYTYSFSRRFYNDRIRVVVGGKIQTGNVPSSQDQTLIDNVALEYQLDKAGEQYLRLYHKRITDNVLEGEHTETGLGYLIKRKLSRPNDLFRFRFYRPLPTEDEPAESKPWEGMPLTLPADTTTRETKYEKEK